MTGEQLEAISGEWKSQPVYCSDCYWSGDSEELMSKMVSSMAGKLNVQEEVCPKCGSVKIEGDY